MTDPILAAEAPEAVAPAPEAVPALTKAQIEEMIQRTTDTRVSGIQSVLGKQIKALQDENKRLSRAQSGEDDDPRNADLEAEVRRLERERDLYRVARDNPTIAPVLEKITPESSYEDIASALTDWATSFTPASVPDAPPAPVPSAPTPPVHPNQPAREPTRYDPSQNMDVKTAWEIIGTVAEWPSR